MNARPNPFAAATSFADNGPREVGTTDQAQSAHLYPASEPVTIDALLTELCERHDLTSLSINANKPALGSPFGSYAHWEAPGSTYGVRSDPVPHISLDHGVLNVPLAKRGNIDAQIDRYKAQQAAEARAAHKVRSAAAADGKARLADILARIPDARMIALGAKMGKRTAATTRAEIMRMARGQYDRFIPALSRELAA